MTNPIQELAHRWIATDGDDPARAIRRVCGTELLAAEEQRLARLWKQTLTAHTAQARAGGALSYLAGMRDGFANATATITGLTRNQVGEHLRSLNPAHSNDVQPGSAVAEGRADV